MIWATWKPSSLTALWGNGEWAWCTIITGQTISVGVKGLLVYRMLSHSRLTRMGYSQTEAGKWMLNRMRRKKSRRRARAGARFWSLWRLERDGNSCLLSTSFCIITLKIQVTGSRSWYWYKPFTNGNCWNHTPNKWKEQYSHKSIYLFS